MIIKGIQKTTLLDFPGNVACTIFTAGCNFRCPFCHNASLVVSPDTSDLLDEDVFFTFLEKRRGILDGVCITGGEPLLQKDIEVFMKKIKDMGFLLKLDTNGSYPEKLSSILSNKLADYVAMDIKSSKEKYSVLCGTDIDTNKISESINILMNGNTPFEFRTTIVKDFHSKEDILNAAKWIEGAPLYFLQSFKNSGDTISKELSAYSPSELHEILDEVKKIIPSAKLRGID